MSEGLKNDADGFVPELRFPEFQGTGEWLYGQLEKHATKIGSGITPRGGSANYGAEGRPFVRSQNVGWGELILDDIVYINEETHASFSSTEIMFNDVLLNISGASIGRSSVADRSISGGNVNQHVCIIRTKAHELEPAFLNQFLLSHEGQSQIDSFQAGGNRQGLNFGQIRSFAIPLPPKLAEQRKIAECLASLDSMITSLAENIETLRTHKTGLIQQLFPREGETFPSLRFGNEGDWTMASLPDVAFFQEGPGIMAVDFRDEGVPLVRLAGVSGPEVTLDGCNYLDPDKVNEKWSHFRLELNDLIISTSATFGLSSVVTDAAVGSVFYTGLIRFKPTSELLTRGYLQAFLGSHHFARQAESAAVGGGIKHFGPTHLKRMEIPIPPLEEQRKISNTLCSLDALITAQMEKRVALKAHKQGLMQQLFPSAHRGKDV